MGAGAFRLGSKLCLALPGLRGLLWLWLMAATCEAFYFPGLVSVTYCEEDYSSSNCQSSIQVYVEKLYSVETAQIYGYDRTLGQILSGDQIISCPYKFSFNKEETCRKVCVKSYNPENKDQMNKLAFLKERIKQNYYHHWIINNIPVIWCYDMEDGEQSCGSGFPIGCFNTPSGQSKGPCLINSEFSKNNSLYLFNHVDITITYHIESDTTRNIARLVGSRVEPKSYKHSDENHLNCNEPPLEIPEKVTDNFNVIYTYSVKFEESETTEWSSELEYDFEATTETNVQWIRLINSCFVILCLCGLMIILIVRSICKDIVRYSRVRFSVYERKQFRRRKNHENIFKPPEHKILLSALLGQGTQVFIMTFFSLFLAGLGFLTPADQRALMSYAVVLWLLLEIPAGYVSAKMYKTFKGANWKIHFLLTTFLFSGIVFADIFIMNIILWMEGSSAAVSFGTLAILFALCFGVSAPLTFLGIHFGKKEEFEFPVHPVETHHVSPKRSFFANSSISIILGSLLPFGCIFLQLSYILNRLWSPHMYYLFAFLFLVFLILMISCSEVTIMLCYFRLCAEDCGWWWRAFLSSGFTSVYILLYAIYYYFTKLQVTGIGNTVLYFGYTLILMLVFFLFTGTIGFFSCFSFITTIYGVMKGD